MGGDDPAPFVLCAISARVSFPFGGFSLLAEVKESTVVRDEASPPIALTSSDGCGHLWWGSAHPQGLLKGSFCAATWPGTIHCSPVSSSSE